MNDMYNTSNYLCEVKSLISQSAHMRDLQVMIG